MDVRGLLAVFASACDYVCNAYHLPQQQYTGWAKLNSEFIASNSLTLKQYKSHINSCIKLTREGQGDCKGTVRSSSQAATLK